MKPGDRTDPPKAGGKTFPPGWVGGFTPSGLEEGEPEDLSRAWREEMEVLAAEPPSASIYVVLTGDPAQEMLEFLFLTGLKDLVTLKWRDRRLTVVSDRPTVSRLVVWQAQELGLGFGC